MLCVICGEVHEGGKRLPGVSAGRGRWCTVLCNYVTLARAHMSGHVSHLWPGASVCLLCRSTDLHNLREPCSALPRVTCHHGTSPTSSFRMLLIVNVHLTRYHASMTLRFVREEHPGCPPDYWQLLLRFGQKRKGLCRVLSMLRKCVC